MPASSSPSTPSPPPHPVTSHSFCVTFPMHNTRALGALAFKTLFLMTPYHNWWSFCFFFFLDHFSWYGLFISKILLCYDCKNDWTSWKLVQRNCFVFAFHGKRLSDQRSQDHYETIWNLVCEHPIHLISASPTPFILHHVRDEVRISIN